MNSQVKAERFILADKPKVLNFQGQTRPQSSDLAKQVQKVLASDVVQKMSIKE